MAVITVGVVNPAETEKVTMQVPTNALVGDLTEAMVEQMGLPMRGANGQRVRYHLGLREPDPNTQRVNVRRLDDNRNLEQNGVQNDDALQLTVEMVAGLSLSASPERKGVPC